jgi:hypothetical protein
MKYICDRQFRYLGMAWRQKGHRIQRTEIVEAFAGADGGIAAIAHLIVARRAIARHALVGHNDCPPGMARQ